MESEFLLQFDKWYSPPFKQNGKVMLDVGAGEGETALWAILKGTKKVFCVEPDKNAYETLLDNIKRNNWPVEAYNESFDPEKHLQLGCDFAKFDCEGCEELLLKYTPFRFPIALEAHGQDLIDRFSEKGFKITKKANWPNHPLKVAAIMHNY